MQSFETDWLGSETIFIMKAQKKLIRILII